MTTSEIYPLLEKLEREEILQLIQFLVSKLAIEEDIPLPKTKWPPDFFAETYGVFKNEPLVREQPEDYERREELV